MNRLTRLAMGLLTRIGRSTITGMLSAAGRDQHDWSADYRLFSRGRFQPSEMFGLVEARLLERLPAGQAVVTALDDTKCRKTGTKIPGVSYQRDPMSPPFHTNFIRAQRFVQLSLMMPLDVNAPAAARAFPIRFRHAPPPPRPGAKASPEQLAAYRRLQKTQNLSLAGAEIIKDCRSTLDSRGAAERTLVVSVDGSYTNRTVLKDLPARTTLIGRISSPFPLPNNPPADAAEIMAMLLPHPKHCSKTKPFRGVTSVCGPRASITTANTKRSPRFNGGKPAPIDCCV